MASWGKLRKAASSNLVKAKKAVATQMGVETTEETVEVVTVLEQYAKTKAEITTMSNAARDLFQVATKFARSHAAFGSLAVDTSFARELGQAMTRLEPCQQAQAQLLLTGLVQPLEAFRSTLEKTSALKGDYARKKLSYDKARHSALTSPGDAAKEKQATQQLQELETQRTLLIKQVEVQEQLKRTELMPKCRSFWTPYSALQLEMARLITAGSGYGVAAAPVVPPPKEEDVADDDYKEADLKQDESVQSSTSASASASAPPDKSAALSLFGQMGSFASGLKVKMEDSCLRSHGHDPDTLSKSKREKLLAEYGQANTGVPPAPASALDTPLTGARTHRAVFDQSITSFNPNTSIKLRGSHAHTLNPGAFSVSELGRTAVSTTLGKQIVCSPISDRGVWSVTFRINNIVMKDLSVGFRTVASNLGIFNYALASTKGIIKVKGSPGSSRGEKWQSGKKLAKHNTIRCIVDMDNELVRFEPSVGECLTVKWKPGSSVVYPVFGAGFKKTSVTIV